MGIGRKRILPSSIKLHSNAEERLSDNTIELPQVRTNEATQRLGQELEIHQIEMEVQNVELRRTQMELESQQIELELQNDELRRTQGELELSRNKYSELYDFAPVGYFTFDPRGVIHGVNIAGSQLLGIERHLLVDKPFGHFIADADGRVVFLKHLETAAQKQGMQRCEIRIVGKDGSMIYGQLQSVMLDDSQSKAGHILSSIVDGTVAKYLAMEVQDAREYAENIVETVREPLVVLNFDLKILTANHSFYDTFKVTPEETIGNFIYDLGNRQWDISKLRVLFEEILPNNSVFNGYEVEHNFPGIGRKIILLNARQIFRKNIGSHIILLAMEDITVRKQVEAERVRLDQILQERNAELESARSVAEKANRAKSEFLSSMSHELRSPLNAILGFAQLLDKGAPLPTLKQKSSINQILKAGWYLLKLINEILDLALIESGRLSMSLEPMSLVDVMLECQAMIEPQAKKSGIRISFPQFAGPCFVHADRTRVKQVLVNLLTNAIKYNRTQGTVEVTCSTTTPERIRISVQDTGAGLSPEKLSQLFQPFNRLGQEVSSEEGTGIGLVMSKRLVELMGGGIGVESVVGKGSVFWIELVLVAAPQLAGDATETRVSAEAPVQLGVKPRTLLYIEDNRANMELVEEIIDCRADLRLLGAGDGTQGIALARIHQPDVILMDINLPGISGIQALKILRADPVTTHIPVLAISANAMPHDIKKGLESGFFRYLTKPINVNEFMEAIDEALEPAEKGADEPKIVGGQ